MKPTTPLSFALAFCVATAQAQAPVPQTPRGSIVRIAHTQRNDATRPQLTARTQLQPQPPQPLPPIPPQPEQVAPGGLQPGTFAPMPGPSNAVAPSVLTLVELEGMALANNPTIAQAAARVQAARGAWDQAGRYPNPKLGYEGTEIGNEGAAGLQGGFVEQEIVTNGKRQLSQLAASREVARLQREFEAQRTRVVNDVRIEFFNVLIAQLAKRLADDLHNDAARRVEIAERARREPAAELGAFEQAQIELDLNAIELMQERANHRYQSAWRRLAGVVGVPTMQQVILEGNPEALIPAFTWEEALGQLLTLSPQLSAARAAVERARFTMARAEAEAHPNFDVRLGAQHDNATGDDVANVEIAVPVPIYNRNQGNIRQAAADLRAAQTEVARVELMLHMQLAAAFERYSNARRQVEKYQQEMRPKIDKSLQQLENESTREGGLVSPLEFLYFRQSYRTVTLAYLEALRELWEAGAVIDGMLLSDSLQAGPSTIPSIGVGPGGLPLRATPLSSPQ